jgi:hypothetical protein
MPLHLFIYYVQPAMERWWVCFGVTTEPHIPRSVDNFGKGVRFLVGLEKERRKEVERVRRVL